MWYLGCEFMPSQTFMNLKEEKRQKLMDAAMKEFSSVTLEKVSINKIVANAQIPRGSFYMYFDDKYDLFYYIIISYQDRLLHIIKNALIKNNGNMRDSFLDLYDELSYKMMQVDLKIFLKNAYNYMCQKNIFLEDPGRNIFERVEPLIKKEGISTTDLEFIFGMFMHNLISSCLDSLRKQEEKGRELYLKKLNLICYGIYQRGKEEMCEIN